MVLSKIILVDDDQGILNVFGRMLTREGYDVHTAKDGKKGLELIMSIEPDLIITDMYMPGIGGLELIERIKKIYPDAYIMVITGDGSIENAVKAMKYGAFSYVQKPLNIDEFLLEVKKITDIATKTKQNNFMKETLNSFYDTFVGESEPIRLLKEKSIIIAKSDSNVLISGESGTGKELIAQAIHNQSKRKDSPIVKVNCAALSSTLLESELFGHEKGAFTGAFQQKMGRFEFANGGTLFLDEIGEMHIEMQAKLLRVIQEKSFERVGGHKMLQSDFRLICATNRNLENEVNEGRFREDLFYRLNVIPIHLPPLRDRKVDVHLLIEYFAEKFSKEMGKEPIQLSDAILEKLVTYDWPGNVRELKNVMERLTVFSIDGQVKEEELPAKILKMEQVAIPLDENLADAKESFEKLYIKFWLEQNDWQITQTAELLGLARKNLYAKIKKYDLRKAR